MHRDVLPWPRTVVPPAVAERTGHEPAVADRWQRDVQPRMGCPRPPVTRHPHLVSWGDPVGPRTVKLPARVVLPRLRKPGPDVDAPDPTRSRAEDLLRIVER